MCFTPPVKMAVKTHCLFPQHPEQLEDLKDKANFGTYTRLRIAHSLFRSNEAEGHTDDT
jgi:hypothetical protein